MAPLAILLQLGTVYVSLIMFSVSALEYAVQEGSRCASVQASLCSSIDSIRIYTTARYLGLGNPVFTPAIASCGNLVSASLSLAWTTGADNYTTQLSASACFPMPTE